MLGLLPVSISIHLTILAVLVKAELSAGTRRPFQKCFGLRGCRFFGDRMVNMRKKGETEMVPGFLV